MLRKISMSLLFMGLAAASSGAEAGFRVLHSFAGGNDGAGPASGLIIDGDKNLFGTTQAGGANGQGTVFRIGHDLTETVLYAFKGGKADGAQPHGGLAVDGLGNLYGTTYRGGVGSKGAAFVLAPDGTETVLHGFLGKKHRDGDSPNAGLVFDAAGNLYGTTIYGGHGSNSGFGTIFELPVGGAYSVIHPFGNEVGGYYPFSPFGALIQDAGGNLYGTTAFGGTGECAGNCGTVFELPASGKLIVLYPFQGQSDGAEPMSRLFRDPAGNLFGTTFAGGGSVSCFQGCGTVFEISTSGSETVLHAFSGGSDGSQPSSGVIMDKDGNLYGVTSLGGDGGVGVVFEIAPDGSETVLHSFTGGKDGGNPSGDLAMDKAQNLYGTAGTGGAFGMGTVFEIRH